ncbi:MAG TPA: FAD-binding protein [Candidatus Megaira endosymbiont of Nemacystus decipiens]|nr:FAD-binding protein [Candidatus Megaera endosymbiont of Nemacystus decipiens]
MTQKHIYDVLIIGAGGAGLFSGILAAEKGLKVAIISKVHPLKSHTIAAQGGINASLGNISKDDWKWHAYDTSKAACGLGDQDSVEYMCKSAPYLIKLLSCMGVEFDQTKDGLIDQRVYGGQSTNFGSGELAHRACFSKDRTGHNILHKLYEKACDLKVKFYKFYFALDLLLNKNKCYGVFCWNIEEGKMHSIFAKNIIIASGGGSQVYATSTSASLCTGDGNGIAIRSKLPLQDMEFIQFHPTAINKLGVLVTEAARSAGGILLNSRNERFMQNYDAKFKELATRDVVARAIAKEINEGRGTGPNKDHVLLDLTHLSIDYIKTNLPTIYENCHHFLKIDPSTTPIPISPAAHYSMGGIPTNSRCQVINFTEDQDQIIEGLYAIGEAASTSVHGAGRLGCNSLLDLIAFGYKVVNTIREESKIEQYHDKQDKTTIQLKNYWLKKFHNESGNILKLNQKLKETTSKYVGIFRSGTCLLRALQELQQIELSYNKLGISDKSLKWNLDFQHYIELGNLIVSAKAIISSAVWRCESRGAHWRIDYPTKNDQKFLYHTIYTTTKNGSVIKKRKVRRVSD